MHSSALQRSLFLTQRDIRGTSLTLRCNKDELVSPPPACLRQVQEASEAAEKLTDAFQEAFWLVSTLHTDIKAAMSTRFEN